jgi:hypothetical protein
VGSQQQAAPRPTMSPVNGDMAGWDPYEVWRTRVLLPRIAAEPRPQLPQALPSAPALVRPTTHADSPTDGTPAVGDRALESDEALMQELIDIVGSLCLVGLTSILVGHAARPPKSVHSSRSLSARTRL